MRRKWKNINCKGTIRDILDCGNVLEDLAEQMGEWRDNLEGNEMTHLPKFDEVNEAADALENADGEIQQAATDLSNALVKAGAATVLDTSINYILMQPYKGRGEPRWMQRDNAIAGLQAVVEFLDDEDNLTKLDDNDEPITRKDGDGEDIPVYYSDDNDDITSCQSELSDAVEEATSVEFPGMFG